MSRKKKNATGDSRRAEPSAAPTAVSAQGEKKLEAQWSRREKRRRLKEKESARQSLSPNAAAAVVKQETQLPAFTNNSALEIPPDFNMEDKSSSSSDDEDEGANSITAKLAESEQTMAESKEEHSGSDMDLDPSSLSLQDDLNRIEQAGRRDSRHARRDAARNAQPIVPQEVVQSKAEKKRLRKAERQLQQDKLGKYVMSPGLFKNMRTIKKLLYRMRANKEPGHKERLEDWIGALGECTKLMAEEQERMERECKRLEGMLQQVVEDGD